jgi:hypothetical protein
MVASVVPGSRVRIELTTPGFYRLGSADIASLLGLREAVVRRLVRNSRLCLTNLGRRVAMQSAVDGSAVYFYGEALSTPYTATNVYFLQRGRGTAARRSSVLPGGAASTSFVDHVRAEQDKVAMPAYFHDPEADFWIWDYLYAGDATYGTRQFSLQAPDALAGQTLGVDLLGLSDTGTPGEHHARIKLNGVTLGYMQFSGTSAAEGSFDIPAGALVPGTNTVSITAMTDTGAAYSMFGVDGFDLTYVRSATAVQDQLLLTAGSSGSFQVSALSRSRVWVFDVTSPRAPVRRATRVTAAEGAYAVTFSATAGRRYLVACPGTARSPQSAVGALAAGAATAVTGAEYLVVCPPGLKAAADGLAAYRASTGLSTAVLTTQQVYDDFSYGVKTPLATRALIARGLSAWTPAPRFVALVGEGSIDYRDVTGFGDSLVPPLLADTEYGLVPTDGLLADVDADDVPDVALGRIPALTPEEVTAYTEKVRRHEASIGDWRARVMFSADNPDSAGDFGADSDYLATLVPSGYAVSKGYLGPLTLTAARASLKGAFTQGSLLINYVGHGGVDRLTTDGLLLQSDVASLTGTGVEPFFVAMTCNVGNFGIPGFDSLGESLAMKADGGAAAVVAPTSMEENANSRMLDAWFLPTVLSSEKPALGAALQSALTDYADGGGATTVLVGYCVLGDPAFKVVQ